VTHYDDEAEGETISFTAAPGVLSALFYTRREEDRARADGYTFQLGDMDIATSSHAHYLLEERDIDHASPAGYINFKTEKERKQAVALLHELDPKTFQHRWQNIKES